MSAQALLIISVATWALLNFWLLPIVTAAWKNGDLKRKAAKAGILVVLERVRDLALVAMCTLLVLLVGIWLGGAVGNVDVAWASSLSAPVSSAYEAVKDWGAGAGKAMGLIALLGALLLLWLTARSAKQRVRESWTEAAKSQFDQFFQDPSVLQTAQSNPKLAPLVTMLNELIAKREALESIPRTAEVEEAIRQADERINAMLSHIAIEMSGETLDVDAALAPGKDEPEPSTVLGRIRRVLVSTKLGADLGLIRRWLSHATTALLVLTLVGWAAEPLANSLRLSANQLNVNLLSSKTTRELAAVSRESPQPTDTPEPPDTQQASQPPPNVNIVAARLSREAVRSLLGPDYFSDLTGSARRAANSAEDMEFVRAALAGNEPAAPEAAGGRPADSLRRETAAAVTESDPAELERKVKGLQDAVQADLQPSVEEFAKTNPSGFRRLDALLKERYAIPLAVTEAQGKVLSEIFGQAFGAIPTGGDSEAARQGARILRDVTRDVLKTSAVSQARAFAIDQLKMAARPTAAEIARPGFKFFVTDEATDAAAEVKAASGSPQDWQLGPQSLADAEMNSKVAEAARQGAQETIDKAYLEEQSQIGALAAQARRDEDLASLADATIGLEGYDPIFPSDIGFRGRSVGLGESVRPAINFAAAMVSFRARGVLIGREPTGPGMEVDDVRWKVMPPHAGAPTRVAVDFLIKGRWQPEGEFDAAVVNQALRYAADKRVVAATIVPGFPPVGRATAVHPALIDTPLGCRIVQADRIVDTIDSDSGETGRLQELSSDRSQMYAWTQFVGVLERVSRADVDLKECKTAFTRLGEESDKSGKGSGQPIVQFSNVTGRSLAAYIASLSKSYPDGGKFLQAADRCARLPAEQLADCACDTVMGKNDANKYWFPEDHTSQVRERELPIEPSLAWFRRSQDHLSNLDFQVHTTFSLRQEPGATGSEDSAIAFSFPAVQLSALRQEIARSLPRRLSGQICGETAPCAPSYEEFMAPIEDFVLLQRFARAALSGKLGKHFPGARLIQLERATRNFVPKQATVRWEPGKDPKGFAAWLGKQSPQAAQAYESWSEHEEESQRNSTPLCDPVSL